MRPWACFTPFSAMTQAEMPALPIWNAFSPAEQKVIRAALRRKLNTPLTTSVGRLFDAAAALAGVRSINRFEGEAAMEWEWLADGVDTATSYPLRVCEEMGTGSGQLQQNTGGNAEWPVPVPISSQTLSVQRPVGGPAILDWEPLVHALLADILAGVSVPIMAARFHNGLIEGIMAVCRLVGEQHIALTGGCFLNRRLLEGAVQRLTAEGYCPCWHQHVPPGDGGIALGQIMAASRGDKGVLC